MGGEKPFLFYGGSSDSGSPPRWRGKVINTLLDCSQRGITPAWAGKSRLRKMYRPAFTGSPPHRRGKGIQADGAGAWAGITPAQAGKRSTGPPLTQTTVDHPRMGGEKPKEQRGDIVQQGSPPHGRGKGRPAQGGTPATGITPAWAGKRVITGNLLFVFRDHPRVGGEKVDPTGNDWYTQGSPPRGRGKDKAEHLVQHHIGITPAQAGKS